MLRAPNPARESGHDGYLRQREIALNFRVNSAPAPIDAYHRMSEIVERFPGAQRALFRRYHIGGCSSCGFSPDETLASVCGRNGSLDVDEVLKHIQSSHQQD